MPKNELRELQDMLRKSVRSDSTMYLNPPTTACVIRWIDSLISIVEKQNEVIFNMPMVMDSTQEIQ